MTTLSLFALTNDPVARVARFPLSSSVQDEISRTFEDQERAFQAYSANSVVFDGKYKPDANEWLLINDFDDIDNLAACIRNPLGIPEIEPTPEAFSSIRAVFSGYEDAGGSVAVLLQAFDRRKIISNAGTSIFYSSQVYKKVDGVGLSLDTKLSAVLLGKQLYFANFHVARQIFDMSLYYAEATDSDLDSFASLPSLFVADKTLFKGLADTWIRRKVALITQSQILQKVTIADIKSSAAIFKINLETTHDGSGAETIVVPNEKAEVKKLLRFLDEDYYQSIFLRQNYVSNSRRLAD